MNLYYDEIDSPVGKLKLVADDSALVAIMWQNEREQPGRFAGAVRREDHPILRAAKTELTEYFAGERATFSVPLRPEGTEFQRRVWREMQAIPLGSCRSYGQLARAIGRPTAARAVGAASGRNPLGILVPCHRVIGQDGSLTGFGGGLKVKADLIAFERQVADKRNRHVAGSGGA